MPAAGQKRVPRRLPVSLALSQVTEQYMELACGVLRPRADHDASQEPRFVLIPVK